MKLYSVRAKTYDWDEYDCFIVWAKNETEALAIAQAEAGDWAKNFNEGAEVTAVTKPESSGILLGSFNAG